MQRIMLRSKIHRATVTDANVAYEGSLGVDRDLLAAADMLAHERVQFVNLANGARAETYIIEEPAGSGTLCLNGAAARLGEPGDTIIIFAYCLLADAQARSHKPIVVHVDDHNRIVPDSPS
ncbi:MAG: aspartate 1-decarboxylase [Planctomycetota bacterium]